MMTRKIAIGVGTVVAAGAVALSGAGIASADTPCKVSPGSVVCTSKNGSFSATHAPGGNNAVKAALGTSSISRTRDGSAVSTTVKLNKDVSASFERDWKTGEFSATATVGNRSATVSGTVGKSLNVDIN